MTTSRTLAAFALIAVLFLAGPAFGGPSLASLIKRVDQREARHYRSLDQRIKATVLLLRAQEIETTTERSTMRQAGDGSSFSGEARCSSIRQTLISGGVDWGGDIEQGDWHIVSSGPNISGNVWRATVNIGSAGTPRTWPIVYAICAEVR